jgi:hypothetical protein
MARIKWALLLLRLMVTFFLLRMTAPGLIKLMTKSTSKITKGLDVIAANPFGLFVDFASMAEMKGMKDVAAFMKLFSEFSGGASLEGGKFSFKLIDASKNSLRAITEVVAAELDRMEKEMNKELESELEEAVTGGLDDLEAEMEKFEDEVEEVLPNKKKFELISQTRFCKPMLLW